MTREIDYGKLMHRAMCSLIKEVLMEVESHGLPGEHHFMITYDTAHPDVGMADWLRERYPEAITIVVQHQYEGLEVGKDGFSITLSFGDMPEPLYIPYNAIQTFVDPSVEFGLRFDSHEDDDEDEGLHAVEEFKSLSEPPAPEAPMAESVEPAPEREAEVVSLDKFRK